jgi:hypothetical protein
MGEDAVPDLVLDPHHRVEGVHRTLRDIGDLLQPDASHLLLGEVEDVGVANGMEVDLPLAHEAG